LFGGAAFKPTSTEADAERVLEVLFQYGVNHIDTAHSYGGGKSETLVGSWMDYHRDQFFLATKTSERTASGALAQLEMSRRRLRVDTIDLIQMHNLTSEDDWAVVFEPGGALEALVEARNQGHVRFIGVTGHGLIAPSIHLRSLERYPFDSVLLPMNYIMSRNASYRADFDVLKRKCDDRGVAVQIIKSTARRPWAGRDRSNGPWYQPLEKAEDIALAVDYALSFAPAFINTTADLDLLPLVLKAVATPGKRPSNAEMEAMVGLQEMQPIFDGRAMIQ
jgi:aryl-alcohol dehydrogenase-like predicted oxidoreductase